MSLRSRRLKQGRLLLLLAVCSACLVGCWSNIFTGANLVYDRHAIYKKVHDFQLSASVSRSLYKDTVFKCLDCSLELAVFNGDVLLVGHLPTKSLRQEMQQRIAAVPDYRRLFNQVSVGHLPNYIVEDSVITAKIRSCILADSSIDPHAFKVVTSEQIVYLMGDVIPVEARKVIRFARDTHGVKRVVTLFKYFNLSDHAVA